MRTPGRPDRSASLWVVAALASGPLVSLGLARFAYALLLPEMQDRFGWTYAQAGVLNTANAVGYLLGALAGAGAARRWGTRRVFLLGTVGTTLALALTALAPGYAALLATRALAGAAGALAFVLGGALVATATSGHPPAAAARLLGLYYGGSGLGMTIAGLLVPLVLERSGPLGWRWGWLSLAAVGSLACLAALLGLRQQADPPPRGVEHRSWRRGSIGWVTAGYVLFGLGYIAYLTFAVAYLAELGAGAAQVAVFWAVLGLAATVGGLAWAPLLGRLGGARGMAAVLAVLALGTLLPLWQPRPWAFLLSAVLVGGSFLSAVTGVTIAVRHVLPAPLWTAGLGFATVAFGVGQSLGPWLSGAVADRAGGIAAGLAASAALLLVGAVLALPQREARPVRNRPS
ncbi:YbfB/YjiJ family MFS transporter [Ornithinimicrobium flavum]|uniref:YbfB/YjiJ family MFS transporter n=1 Tax=Ornithinimicrobium flavum TaxID=1288636 RepID=UPI00106F7F5E|nr:YbfB/YjiJ family MFS transporter [Ornithinimicrobium flavum]